MYFKSLDNVGGYKISLFVQSLRMWRTAGISLRDLLCLITDVGESVYILHSVDK